MTQSTWRVSALDYLLLELTFKVPLFKVPLTTGGQKYSCPSIYVRSRTLNGGTLNTDYWTHCNWLFQCLYMVQKVRECSLCPDESTNHTVLSGTSGSQIRADVESIIGAFPTSAEGTVICRKCEKVFHDFVKLKEKVQIFDLLSGQVRCHDMSI